jgi:hypothetical protein
MELALDRSLTDGHASRCEEGCIGSATEDGLWDSAERAPNFDFDVVQVPEFQRVSYRALHPGLPSPPAWRAHPGKIRRLNLGRRLIPHLCERRIHILPSVQCDGHVLPLRSPFTMLNAPNFQTVGIRLINPSTSSRWTPDQPTSEPVGR